MKKATALLFGVVFLCLTVSGCGGTKRLSKISAIDIFSKEKISILYACSGGDGDGGSTPFSTSNLNEIEDAISTQLEGVTIEKFSGSLLLSKKEAYGVSYYLIQNMGDASYVFSGLGAGIEGMTCIFPFHLIDMQKTPIPSGGSYTPLETQKEYAMLKGTKKDFYDFYKQSNKYIIDETEDGFTLSGYTFPYAVDFYPYFTHQIVFHFIEGEDGSLVYLTAIPL